MPSPIDAADGGYSVIDEAYKLLHTAILDHTQTSKLLPPGIEGYLKRITFTGSTSPSIPVNWRFQESVSVLKALEGAMINALLHKKYGVEAEEIEINADHAQLFVISCLLTEIHAADGANVETEGFATTSVFPSCDIYRNSATPYRTCAGNLYKTKDDRYFHLHSDLNPDVIQDALGLPHEADGGYDKVYQIYQDKTMQYTSDELDQLDNGKLRRSGTIAYSPEEYRQTAHGKAEADTGLWEVDAHPNAHQEPCWWPSSAQTSPARPLAGLKVVDFSRIIAAPTATRGLAEFGASVMRVTAGHLPDMGVFHADMGWGKWNCHLDFRQAADVEKVRALILDADVVVYGYRPSVLNKYGLGSEAVLKLCEQRKRGVIILRLNSYGWVGPWSDRSGWQQISDACCGVSLGYGRALHGVDEPVTPVFPQSDHCAGIAGELGVISALMMRAEKGGSYTVSCSLNAYSQWLVNQIGTYPEDVWQKVWALHGRPKFRHYHPMQYLFPTGVKLLRQNTPHVLDEDFFEVREAKAMGCKVRCVKPVLRFPSGNVQPGFQVSARTNGVDQPVWPSDLLTEKIS